MGDQFINNLLFLFAITLLALGWNIRFINKRKRRLAEILDRKSKQLSKQHDEIQLQKSKLEAQKEKVEDLLHNLLPAEAVDELKSKGTISARHYSHASVLFTDIKGFTRIASKLRPQELVAILDRYFSAFDKIIDHWGLEKIKTIGDSYMCAGGVPKRNNTHPFDMVLAALEIQAYMRSKKELSIVKGEEYLDLRIGIHTGEVVAGAAGKKRMAYDIWGDTVNQAHLMEEACDIEKVNISGSTFQIIAPLFQCTYRGQITTKSDTNMDMYYVERIKPEFSADEQGIKPDPLFFRHMNMLLYSKMRFLELQQHVLQFLKKNLPKDLKYHSLQHTKDVEAAVQELALAEGIHGEDFFLLKSAALLHDIGFTERYQGNEEIGARLASDLLPKFGYNQKQVDTVIRLILSTTVPQNPTNQLERIICDADLYYLGTTSFEEKAFSLFEELQERNIIATLKEWDKIQLNFLEKHVYHTRTGVAKLRPQKLKNYEAVKRRFEKDEY